MYLNNNKNFKLLIIGLFDSVFLNDYISQLSKENIQIDLLTTFVPKKVNYNVRKIYSFQTPMGLKYLLFPIKFIKIVTTMLVIQT